MVWRRVDPVRGASGASGVHFGKNFIKQKLQGRLWFSEGRSIFQTPNSNPEGPGPMSFWSCGPHHRERVCTFTKLLFGGDWALLKTKGPMQFFEFYQRWVLQFGNLALALRSCLHSTGEIFAKGWLKKGYCFYAIVMDCFSWVTFDLLQILFRLEPRGPNLSIIP